MKRILVAVLAALGLALAQALVVEVEGSLEDVEARALKALEAAGLQVDRVLNLGEQVRQVTGPGFPEYRLLVLKPEKGSVAAVSKNPIVVAAIERLFRQRCEPSPAREEAAIGAACAAAIGLNLATQQEIALGLEAAARSKPD